MNGILHTHEKRFLKKCNCITKLVLLIYHVEFQFSEYFRKKIVFLKMIK